MMIGIALVIVTRPGSAPQPHKLTWMSEGWLHAPVELLEWKRKTEQEQGCTLEIQEWKLKERQDIGV